MTTQAHLSDRRPADLHLADRPTVGLEARHPFVVDSFSLLDHRTRARSVAEPLASPGRYLAVEDGDQVRLIALEQPVTHIGRGLSADVRIEDSHVSRRHSIVAHRGGGVRLLDDRSSNGTFVNGRAVTVADLVTGDVIRVGRVAFRYLEVRPRPKAQPLRRIPLVRRARRLEPVPPAA